MDYLIKTTVPLLGLFVRPSIRFIKRFGHEQPDVTRRTPKLVREFLHSHVAPKPLLAVVASGPLDYPFP